ncbi:MAG: DinB family protein [Pseudomonas sp.]|uniref:DinB family protein n=1 Tax=Pseudomonas sp. TaxID=306 RepID=UPI003399CE54
MSTTALSATPQWLSPHLRQLLRYHGWAYRRLIDSLQRLEATAYQAPCGLFFGSPHGTLNHLAVADRIWLARVRGEPAPFTRLDAEVATDLAGVRDFIAEGIAGWQAWLQARDDHGLSQVLTYRNSRGDAFSRVLADVLLHLVNHGSHHRGQISAALTSLGQPAPVLDYIYFLNESP